MKISNLFHWLYAFLMLLPVFFVGGRCLYVTFNKNAKDSYYGETINDIQYINIDTLDMEYNETYYMFIDNYQSIDHSQYAFINVGKFTNLNDNTKYENAELRIFYNTTLNNFIIRIIRDGYSNVDLNIGNQIINLELKFISYASYNNPDFDFVYKPIYNKYSYLDNAFIYSVNSLNDTPLFSWAKTSFLVAPFSYISGLFGIESTSPINTMLSYWLAISIIWLVFDLIMYVPLLVHRWIDKAKLE